MRNALYDSVMARMAKEIHDKADAMILANWMVLPATENATLKRRLLDLTAQRDALRDLIE